jgi:hypothetical protein
MRHCTAYLSQSVPVLEAFESKTVREGVVHVFDLAGHAKVTRGHVWSSPIEGSDKLRFFAVPHVPPVTSPIEAVRARIIAEQRASKRDA